MAEPTTALLEEVLGQVLQDAAFVFAEPAEEPDAWGAPLYAVKLAFESVRGGELRLTAGPAAAVEIAANMLGVAPGDPEAIEQSRAALGEILNIIGGAFVTRFFGTKVPSQLGLPVVEVVEGLPGGRRTCAAAVKTETGEPVLLELDLEEAVAL